MIVHTQYQCEKCKTLYTTAELAERCEAQTSEPVAKAGDIVTVSKCYGWYEGDKSWVSNPDVRLGVDGYECPNGDNNCFAECCNYSFFYVVSVVHIEEADNRYTRDTGLTELRPHRWKYHLFTRALPNSPRGGYTFDDGSHHRPVVVQPQPKLRGVKKLIGKRAEHLL